MGPPASGGERVGAEAEATHGRTARTLRVGRRWRLLVAPGSDLYPRALADPRRPLFMVARTDSGSSEIPRSSGSRIGIRLGGRYGFLRLHRAGRPETGVQLDAEAGFLGWFDREMSTDNIGWDGLYGFHLSWTVTPTLALRAGLFHDSSHVGDEYAERTGRRRLAYTRGEYLLSASWAFAPRWRTYLEGGWAHDLRNEEIMEPGRVQGGLEHRGATPFWKGRWCWYAATDVSAYQENDWSANITLQTGLELPVAELSRSYRFGLEYYDGRSTIGEFFLRDERHLSLGFWFDL